MSKFFDNSDLIRNDVDKIVSDTLKNCDDGELYFEDSKSESILLDDNKIKSSNYSSDLGFGFIAISNDIVAYSRFSVRVRPLACLSNNCTFKSCSKD